MLGLDSTVRLAFPGDPVKILRRGDPRPAGNSLSQPRGRRFLGQVDGHVDRPIPSNEGSDSSIPQVAGRAADRETPRRGAWISTRSAISKDGDDPIMRRKLVAGMLGLAVAGCAHTRSEIPKETPRNTTGPVGITPIPPLSQTINRGVGDPATTKTALRDPEDARWSGQAPGPGASRPGTSSRRGASLAQGPSQSAAPASIAGPQGPADGLDSQPPGTHDAAIPTQSASPAMAATATATATAGSSLRGMTAQPGATSVPEEPMVLAPPGSMADGPTPDARSQAGTPGTPPGSSPCRRPWLDRVVPCPT